MMSLMGAAATPPQRLKEQWSVAAIKRNMLCGICLVQDMNNWNSCLRRSAIINCHMGFCSRARQMWFLIMQVIKYLPIPKDIKFWPTTKFDGSVPFGPTIVQDKTRNPTLPTTVHNAEIVTYGKKFYFITG